MTSQQETLNINGVDVHVTVDGPENETALTFAHALSLDLRSFGPQVEAFRDKYKVVRLDLRGHGKSDIGGGPFSMEDLAGDVAGVLDRLRIKRTQFARRHGRSGARLQSPGSPFQSHFHGIAGRVAAGTHRYGPQEPRQEAGL